MTNEKQQELYLKQLKSLKTTIIRNNSDLIKAKQKQKKSYGREM